MLHIFLFVVTCVFSCFTFLAESFLELQNAIRVRAQAVERSEYEQDENLKFEIKKELRLV